MSNSAADPSEIWKIEIEISRNFIPLVEETLFGCAENDFPTLSDFEIIEGDDIRLLEAYYTQKPDLAKLKEALKTSLETFDQPLPEIRLQRVENEDWVSKSQKILKPVDAGRFFVYGSHDADKLPEDKIGLLVEAGQAFGTGQHETTNGCLRALCDLAEGEAPESALDLGCGSGILALAMCKLWPIRVMASDIDPIATETSLLNARVNDVDIVEATSDKAGLCALTSDGMDDEILHKSGPYKVITANILAGPLQEMAHDIVPHLTPKGHLILSGLLASQEEAVLKAYEAEGLVLKKRYCLGEWNTLMLVRK